MKLKTSDLKNIGDQLYGRVWHPTYNQVFWQVRTQIMNRVYDQVFDQIRCLVRDQINEIKTK